MPNIKLNFADSNLIELFIQVEKKSRTFSFFYENKILIMMKENSKICTLNCEQKVFHLLKQRLERFRMIFEQRLYARVKFNSQLQTQKGEIR